MILSVVAANAGKAALKYLGLAAVGAGALYGVQCYREKSARDAIKAKPLIVENAAQIDTARAAQILTGRAYVSSVGGFRAVAAEVRSNPSSTPAARACVDRAEEVISRCDARHAADTTLIALYRKRAALMEDEAVRARRGKFLVFSAAGGYQPIEKAPAGRLGVDVNFSDRWSATGTFDAAAALERDSAGKVKPDFRPSAFVGLKYSFGGRR